MSGRNWDRERRQRPLRDPKNWTAAGADTSEEEPQDFKLDQLSMQDRYLLSLENVINFVQGLTEDPRLQVEYRALLEDLNSLQAGLFKSVERSSVYQIIERVEKDLVTDAKLTTCAPSWTFFKSLWTIDGNQT